MTKDKISITFEVLMDKLSTYMNSEELKVVKETYEYACIKYFGLKRLSGEDFINHPLAVTYILAETEADISTICASLLHDVLIECNSDEEELRDKFGKEVCHLVVGVTKVNRLSLGSDSEAVLNQQRKILVGLTEDVRVIIIKLAERLHNMRTLWVFPEKKQKEKAKETLDILIPIAHRLGMNKIKSELEDLSLRYYKPEVYFDIVEKLNQSKTERDNLVVEMQQCVSNILNEHGIKHEIKGRAKSIFSIYKKLDNGKRFNEIYDLLALRVYVDTEALCYQTLGIIHSKYKPIPKRFKDYIAIPKTNMYQSLHTTVFGIDGNLFEIQIRTYEMDQIAEHGIASHWSYKEKGSTIKANIQNEMEQKLQFFRSIIEIKEDASEEAFVKTVKDEVFKDTIYVFTPKGDVIELPKGSTPIDFAYKVHSGVGDKMVGAIVNNYIVPFDYELVDNDIVKINTNKNSVGPSLEWINMAKTTQAKNKIKSFFNKIDKDEYAKKGEESLLKELKKLKIASNEFLNTDNISNLLNNYKCNDMSELYMFIGSNKFTSKEIISYIKGDNASLEDLLLKKSYNKEVVIPNSKNDIIVEGINDIKVNIASCCKPIPGDNIIGYITKGYGITVHRMSCPNVSNLEERLINVKWNELSNKKFLTSILIHTHDKKNLLLDIMGKSSNCDINIESFNTISNGDGVIYDVTVLVYNVDKLNKFMNDLLSISEVDDVERSFK